MHTPRRDVDDKEDVVPNQPEPSQYLHREEVRAGKHAKMRFDERGPTRTAPTFPRGFDSAFLEDGLDRVASEVMPQVEECASGSRVSPGRVLLCHANDKRPDVRFRSLPSRAAFLRTIVLGRDQVPVPTQQRVRGDCAEGSKRRPTDGFGLLCESPTLRVRPANPLVANLLTQ